jgi:hypothetical protein
LPICEVGILFSLGGHKDEYIDNKLVLTLHTYPWPQLTPALGVSIVGEEEGRRF